MKEKIDEIFYDLKHELITEKEAHERVLALLDVSSQRELLSGYASYIHKNMNFLDAHSPHVHIDKYLDTL